MADWLLHLPPVIYHAALLACVVTGLYQLVRHPELVRHYGARDAVLLGGMLLLFFLGVIVFGGLEFYFEGGGSVPVIEGAFLTSLLMLMVCVTTWPAGKENDRAELKHGRLHWLQWVGTMSVLALGWSLGFFFGIQLFIEVREVDGGIVQAFLQGSWFAYLMMCCVALGAAVWEEVVFRGYLQGRLERTALGTWGAVIVAAFIFALGHANFVEPWGIKEFQIFVLGLLFGWTKLRFGLLAAVLVHMAHNGVSLAIQAVLMLTA